MRNIKSKVLVSLLISSQLSLVYGASLIDDAKSAYKTMDSLKIKHWNDGKFYIDAKAQYGQSFWDPGLSDEDPKNKKSIITYETEGLGFYKAQLDVGYSGSSVFTYSKLSSITKTANQEELLTTNKDAQGGVDGYTMGFSPEAVVAALGIDNKIINTLLTYRFHITDNAFFGVATAESDFYYQDSTSDKLISQGETISFKTTFKEQRHTVSSKFLSKHRTGEAYMRFGVYQSEWTKPTSFGKYENGKDVIELANYSTTGVTLVYTNYQGTKVPGLNYDMTVDYGLDNTFQSDNSDMKDGLGDKENLAYGAVKLDLSYKYLLLNTKHQRFSLILGGYIDYKSWSISDGNKDTEDVKLDAETLYKVYSSVSYRFAY